MSLKIICAASFLCLVQVLTIRAESRTDTSYYVQKYRLEIEPIFLDSSIEGVVTFYVSLREAKDTISFDLDSMLCVDSVISGGRKMEHRRIGNRVYVSITDWDGQSWKIYYHGRPRVAPYPPWIGGVIWDTHTSQKPYFSVACQGEGASIWWPCKDVEYEEPKDGVQIEIIHSREIHAIGNGRLLTQYFMPDGKVRSVYEVQSPINLYNVHISLGDYSLADTVYASSVFHRDTLDINYAVFSQDSISKIAYLHHQVFSVLDCFERLFGAYPFYEDGYKIIEENFLGMEHQSAIAYGNHFGPGYAQTDLSGTGVGMYWDFIVVHETAHEWWGNSVTADTKADMWIHEAFASYAEVLYIGCKYDKDMAYRYARGVWKKIKNDIPVQGDLILGLEGSGDMYFKGSAMLHMIRVMMDDDERFYNMLRDIQATYYRQEIQGVQVEEALLSWSLLPLRGFLDQYLRTTNIPKLILHREGEYLRYKMENIVDDFFLKYKIWIDKKPFFITLDNKSDRYRLPSMDSRIELDPNYLIDLEWE